MNLGLTLLTNEALFLYPITTSAIAWFVALQARSFRIVADTFHGDGHWT